MAREHPPPPRPTLSLAWELVQASLGRQSLAQPGGGVGRLGSPSGPAPHSSANEPQQGEVG